MNLSADAVRNEKVKVLQALPRWRPEDVYRNVVRAQYTAGSIQGTDVPGYLQEKGVSPDSKTDTYVAIRLELNNWRWAGVPFFLRTGKRLPKRATEIAIQFRRPPTELFEPESDGQTAANQLVLRIQPNEGASLTFEAKIPGSRRRLQEVRMDFRYGTAFAVPPPEAYERLLLDVMLGDQSLFTRTDEVESAWRFITADPRRLEAARCAAAGHLRRRELGPRGGRRPHRPAWGPMAQALSLPGDPDLDLTAAARRRSSHERVEHSTQYPRARAVGTLAMETETVLVQEYA